jgi:hypothetical protein
MESQERSSRLPRVSATGNFMDYEPSKFKAGLIFGTALANERDERISTMLPDKRNTFLDTLDTIFTPTSSRTHHGPLGSTNGRKKLVPMGQNSSTSRQWANGRNLTTATWARARLTKPLDTLYDIIEGNTFYDTIKANLTDASRLATSQRRSFGRRLAPRSGFSSPDSNVSDHRSSDANSLPASELSKNSAPDDSTPRLRVTFADETSDARTASDGRNRRRSTRVSKL